MRKQVIAAALVGTLALVGCTSQPADTADDAPVAEDTAVEEEPEEVVEKEAEPEAKTAEVGELIDYAANAGGTFVVTADGFEWSAEAASMGGAPDGYLECYLLLTVENADVDTTANPYIRLGRMWLEDADGVTVEPANSGFNYGEYGAAPGGGFDILPDQTVRIAIPYQLPEGGTDYTLVIDGTRVPLTLIEGARPIG